MHDDSCNSYCTVNGGYKSDNLKKIVQCRKFTFCTHQVRYDNSLNINLAELVESNQQRTKSIEVTARNTQTQANSLQEQLENAKKGVNDLIHLIAKGGDQLRQFQGEFRKGLSKSAELDKQRQQERDRGHSR